MSEPTKVHATLHLHGGVPRLIGLDTVIPEKGWAVVLDDYDGPSGDLYLDGRCVGQCLNVRPDLEYHFDTGGSIPAASSTVASEIDAILEWPA